MDKQQTIDAYRDRIVAHLVQIGGLTRHDAIQVFDIALHACEEAQRTVAKTTELLSPELRASAVVLAMVFLGGANEDLGRELAGRERFK